MPVNLLIPELRNGPALHKGKEAGQGAIQRQADDAEEQQPPEPDAWPDEPQQEQRHRDLGRDDGHDDERLRDPIEPSDLYLLLGG